MQPNLPAGKMFAFYLNIITRKYLKKIERMR
jgi:hypothetical protein